MRIPGFTVLATFVACTFVYSATGLAAGAAADARRLHIQQQQDSLDLSLRQNLRGGRAGLSAADERRIDHLHMQQRLEQQQLEMHQVQREHALRAQASARGTHDVDRHLELQRDLAAQDRMLQNQRFELERHRLLQTLPQQPLQSRRIPGQLNLP